MRASFSMTFCSILITSFVEFISGRSPPQLNLKDAPQQLIVRPGFGITLKCPVSHSRDVIFEWYKDKESVTTFRSHSRIRILNNGSLRIKKTVYDDTGVYRCRAVNGFGSVEYNTTLLIIGNEEDYDQYEVIYDPDEVQEESSKIVITSKPQIIYVNDQSPISKKLGSTFMLQCVATGFPKPEMMWYKDGIPINSHFRIGRWALKFTKALSTDTGNYTCVAANAAGKTSHSFILEVGEKFRSVRGKPLITGSNQTVAEGEVAVMECGVESASSPHIEWLKQVNLETDNLDPTKHAITMEGEYYYVLTKPFSVDYLLKDGVYYPKLTIENARLEDAGKYVCLGANTYGYDYHFTYLEVIPRYSGYPSVSFPIVVTAVVMAVAVLGCIVALLFHCRPRHRRRERHSAEIAMVTKEGFIPMHIGPTNVLNCNTKSCTTRSPKQVTYVAGLSSGNV